MLFTWIHFRAWRDCQQRCKSLCLWIFWTCSASSLLLVEDLPDIEEGTTAKTVSIHALPSNFPFALKMKDLLKSHQTNPKEFQPPKRSPNPQLRTSAATMTSTCCVFSARTLAALLPLEFRRFCSRSASMLIRRAWSPAPAPGMLRTAWTGTRPPQRCGGANGHQGKLEGKKEDDYGETELWKWRYEVQVVY